MSNWSMSRMTTSVGVEDPFFTCTNSSGLLFINSPACNVTIETAMNLFLWPARLAPLC